MKKITLVIALFMGAMTMNAQADCDNAQSVDITIDGTVSVDADGIAGTPAATVCNGYYDETAITQGAWYSFSSTEELSVTINAPVPADTDNSYVPSYNVYSGTCDDLTCINGILVTQSDDNSLNDAELTLTIEANTEYYIVFDDNYNGVGLGTLDGFTFSIETSSDIPEGPEAVTDPTPEDGATNVAVDQNADGAFFVAFEWTPATTGPEATSYEIFLSNPDGDDPTALISLGSTPNTAVNVTGMTFGDLYYWKVVAKNAGGAATDSATWSFTTEDEAGLEDFAQDAFTQYVQAGVLNVESNTQIQSITVFNILGQQVATQKVNDTKGNVSLNQLNSGVYLAKVQMDGQTKTFKFVKK